MGRRASTYKGRAVDCDYRYVDEDADTVCLNDDCPGIEVLTDEDTGEICGVTRIAYDCGWIGPTGPTYSCGGEPGYHTRECPECGDGEADSL